MADLAARREARIRKILENSENRLRRIGGVENKSIQERPPVPIRNSNHGDHMAPDTSDGHRREALDLDCPPNRIIQNRNADLLNLMTQFAPAQLLAGAPPTPSPENPASSSTYTEHRRAMVICAIAAVYCVFATVSDRIFSESSTAHLNPVFAPLFMYELYEFTFLNRQPNVGTVMSYVLLFIESRTGRAYASAMKILIRFGDVLHDLFVYFFVYAICNLLVSSIV